MTDELTMAKADEDAQRVYAKKLAADRESQKRKRAEESKEQQGNRLEAKERKTAQLDEDPPGQRESKHIKTENDSDDDWVWDFDLDKVMNAYQILVKKQRFGDMYFIVKLKNKEEKEN